MDSSFPQEILKKSLDQHQDIVKIRRRLHMMPEIGHEEHETSKYLAVEMQRIGLDVVEGIAGTGVVGILRGNFPGETVALRADIDALPLDEENDIPYKSRNKGCMHACGHDSHMAMLLGSARILIQYRERLNGNVKFIFQPAEELAPYGGAQAMISEGVLENPEVTGIFGLHNWPELPSGDLGVRTGYILAANDFIRLNIIGKGGHGAILEEAVNPVYLAAEVLIEAQSLVDKIEDSLKPALISIPFIRAGFTYNVVPEQAVLEGSVRYLNPDAGPIIRQQLDQMASSLCQSAGGSSQLEYKFGYPALYNDQKMTSLVGKVATDLLGEKKVHLQAPPTMVSDDFAHYSREVPGCYFLLGNRNPDKGIVHSLHSTRFNVDEDILPLGSAIFADVALRFLGVAEE